MSGDPLDLAGLLAARLCHDLAGPVGALVNGAELVADEPDPAVREEFIGMIADGARAVGARVRFYRLAYGGATGGPDLACADARAALSGLLALDGRLALDWRLEALALPRDEMRLLLVLAHVAADSSEGRGTLTVTPEAVAVTAHRTVLGSTAVMLLGGGPATGSATAPAAVAAALADRAGVRVRIDAVPDQLSFNLDR